MLRQYKVNSAGEEITYNIRYCNTGDNQSPWDIYEIESAALISDKYKVHVSIDQSQLDRAAKIILPLFAKYKVHLFKMLPKHFGEEKRNLNGKELIICMQKNLENSPENDAAFWIKVLNELEDELVKANIKPNPIFKPQCDILFPGSIGYVYYRYTTNILGRYISADELSRAGFTNKEGQNLTANPKYERWFAGKFLHEERNTPPVTNDQPRMTKNISRSPVDKVNVLAKVNIITQYKNDIAASFSIFFGNRNDQAQISYAQNDKYQCEEITRLFKDAFGIKFSQDFIDQTNLTEVDVEGIQQQALPLKGILEHCLDTAADFVSKLQNNNNIKLNANQLGNITPAVYQYFFKPVMKDWKEQKKKNPTQGIAPNPHLIERAKFVYALIECSIRDRSVNQLEHSQAHYIDGAEELAAEVNLRLQVNQETETVPATKSQQPAAKDMNRNAPDTMEAPPADAKSQVAKRPIQFISEENVKKIKNVIAKPTLNWKLSEAKKGDQGPYRIVTNGADEEQFRIYVNKITTKKQQDEIVFRAMLESFHKIYGEIPPTIKTLNDANKKLWEKLIAEKYPDCDVSKVITLIPLIPSKKTEPADLDKDNKTANRESAINKESTAKQKSSVNKESKVNEESRLNTESKDNKLNQKDEVAKNQEESLRKMLRDFRQRKDTNGLPPIIEANNEEEVKLWMKLLEEEYGGKAEIKKMTFKIIPIKNTEALENKQYYPNFTLNKYENIELLGVVLKKFHKEHPNEFPIMVTAYKENIPLWNKLLLDEYPHDFHLYQTIQIIPEIISTVAENKAKNTEEKKSEPQTMPQFKP